MRYKNPIPNVDDKEVAKSFCLSVKYIFNEEVTMEEAVAAIESYIKENGIPSNSVHFAEKPQLRTGGANE